MAEPGISTGALTTFSFSGIVVADLTTVACGVGVAYISGAKDAADGMTSSDLGVADADADADVSGVLLLDEGAAVCEGVGV